MTDARVRARLDRVKLTSWPSSDAYEVSCRVRARVFARLPYVLLQEELHPKDACRRPENLWVPRSRQSGVVGCDGRRWRDSAYGGRQTRLRVRRPGYQSANSSKHPIMLTATFVAFRGPFKAMNVTVNRGAYGRCGLRSACRSSRRTRPVAWSAASSNDPSGEATSRSRSFT